MRPLFPTRNPRNPLYWFVICLAITLFLLNVIRPVSAASPDGSDATTNSLVLLPLVGAGGPAQAPAIFNPLLDTTLAGGQYTFDGLDIPAGVVVTVEGPLTLQINGNATIAGTLTSDCVAITVQAQGDLIISGTVDNRCSDPVAENAGDLQLYSHGGLQAGTLEQPATILTSGNLDVSNDPATPLWQFDVLPDQRSNQPLAPACAASADSLWATALPNDPATIRFSGEGADPDGGPLDFTWDFGDQSPVASGAQVTHDYTAAGEFSVTLTVSDDDGQSCAATLALNIEDGENLPVQPVVSMQPVDLVIPVGKELAFTTDLADAQEGDLTVAWAFGDNTISDVLTATHSYAGAGRYEISLRVTDGDSNQRQATAAVYVYEPAADVSPAAMQAFCPPNALPPGAMLVNQANINNLPPAAPGRDGRNQTYRGRGIIILAPGLVIRGQDGGSGAARAGAGTVHGQNGGNGGGITIVVDGRLVVCAGVMLAAGDGGRGGDATATAPPVQTARAFAGRGGNAGSHIRLQATVAIDFEGPVTVDPGSGGDGGDASATGDDGADGCNTAQDAAHALAVGGRGGNASKLVWRRGAVNGIGNVRVVGGLGGFGGDGRATGGKGGAANCPADATGGQGGRAIARGGDGGHARLSGAAAAGVVVDPLAFIAGDGGWAFATGGNGGAAVATPPGACASTTAKGGHGNRAEATGGNGGQGRVNGDGGEGHATGGNGGPATATGGDCTPCNKGGDATATGGKGGGAYARAGRPIPAGDGSAAKGGDGGLANATGGKGGDCPTCPGGKGGDGGLANATGGKGGDASGRGAKTGGNGGLANALGGKAGKGADCCNPPKQGGNGGKGGDATSTAGAGGAPGGQVGGNAQQAGDGGNGGEGEGPGMGGPGGVGTGIPFDILDGVKGLDGARCPVTITVTPTITDPVGTTTPTETVTPIPSETPTATPTPQPTPVITGVKVTTGATGTTPSRPVTLTAKLEGEHLAQIDSFFDIFFTISSRELISDRVPAVSDGAGGYQVVHQFTAAGDYLVDTLVIRKADGASLPQIRDPQPLHVAPIPTELVALSLTSYAPGIQPGMADMLLLVGRDAFGNPIPNPPPSAIQCLSSNPAIQLGSPAPLPPTFFDLSGAGLGLLPVDKYLGVSVMGVAYGAGDVNCTHLPSGATATLPVAFAPWRLQMGDPQQGPGLGFAQDSFFDIFFEVRLPVGSSGGWQNGNGRLDWPSSLPVSFESCRPNLEQVMVNCQFEVGMDGISHLVINFQSPQPQTTTSVPLIIRFATQGGGSETAIEGAIQLANLELTGTIYDANLFAASWWLHPFAIKPVKTLKLHVYRVEGAATTGEVEADVTQAQRAFTLNALLCTCAFYLKLDVISTTVTITDWQKIDPDGDGFDRLDANGDGDFDDEGDHNDPQRAQDEGFHDNDGGTASVYYVPGIGGGALGVTYAPGGQAAVHNGHDHDGWTLFHELVHVLDLRKDGDFDINDSPDDPNNEQGAQNPGNGMNYDEMGPFLTKKQCTELG